MTAIVIALLCGCSGWSMQSATPFLGSLSECSTDFILTENGEAGSHLVTTHVVVIRSADAQLYMSEGARMNSLLWEPAAPLTFWERVKAEADYWTGRFSDWRFDHPAAWTVLWSSAAGVPLLGLLGWWMRRQRREWGDRLREEMENGGGSR